MANLTDYAENEILDHSLGTGSWTMPTQLYLGLFTSNPGDTVTVGGVAQGEVANSNGYARQSIDFGAASGGSASNSTSVSFTASGGSWGTVTHAVLFDSGTYGAGNAIWHGALNSSRVVGDGDTLTVSIGQLTISLA